MRHIGLPLYRPLRDALERHARAWSRSSDTEGKLQHLYRFLTPLVIERGTRNNGHHPYGSKRQVLVDDGTYAGWWDIYTPTFAITLNRLVDRIDLALEHGATMDDVLLALGSDDGYVENHGRKDILVQVSLAELLSR